MKIARVLLLAALLLSAFSSAAFASDEAVGFVQLVPQRDAGTPLSVQAAHALQRLKPQLLDAQHAGQIIRFQPSLHAGILKIVYRPSTDLPFMAGARVYSQVQEALPATAPQADYDVTCGLVPKFLMYLYEDSFEAGCLTPGARLVGSLRDARGRVVATSSDIVDAWGNIYYAAWVWGSPSPTTIPGYTVTFKQYVGGVLTGTYHVKAPNINFTSINKKAAVVYGTGQAGKPGTFYWYHQRYDAAETVLSATKNRTVSASGTWQVDFGATPIRGGDWISADINANGNFIFSREMFVPYMYCRLAGNLCELAGFPLTPATIQIIHGGRNYTFNGAFDEAGWFDAQLKTAAGAPIFLVASDKVSGTGVAQYGLPKLTAGLNYTTDTVTGKVPPYRYFYIWLYEANAGVGHNVYTRSNGYGSYAANLMTTHAVNLVAGDPYIVEVEFTQPSTGNYTELFKAYGP